MEHTVESIEKKIKAIVAHTLKANVDDFNTETRLVEELGADSLDAISIALDVDEEFGISVNDQELRRFNSCGEIVLAVVRHLKTEAATGT